MMSVTIQYIIIAIIFGIAVLFIIKKFLPNKKKNAGGCGKGCGCEYTESKKT